MSSHKGPFASPASAFWGRLGSGRSSTSRKTASPSSEPLPETIGKYRVLGRLGVGAMGVVYKCSQPGLDRPVAVKVMIAGRHASNEQILRFQREAWAAGQLVHPNVLQVYDVGTDGDLHYFVMEFVDGQSLDHLIATGALTLGDALRVVAQLARALEAAHAQGIIHRDIKPSNIILHSSGVPKLSDFGLAKSLTSDQNLSQSGDLIGTPRYMSPEQALAAPQDIDHRTDIYSLGSVLYEMLTGRPPVEGVNVLTVLRRLTDEDPVPLRELSPGVPEEVAAVCRRAMAKDRAERFATAAAFAEAIEGYLAGRPAAELASTVVAAGNARRRAALRRGRWAAPAAVVVLVAVLMGLLFRSPAPTDVPPPDTTDDGRGGNDSGAGQSPTASHSPSSAGRPATRPDATIERVNGVLARVGSLVEGHGLGGTATPRERWQEALKELDLVLLLDSKNATARFLRARLRRQGGQYLSAVDDLSSVLRGDPKNLKAVSERLLANYELHVLYLGHLGERLLRPLREDVVRDDLAVLVERGSATQKHVAQIISALARLDYVAAAKLAEKGLPAQEVRAEDLADVCMVEADALYHAAEAKSWEGLSEPHDQLLQKANAILGRGLDANHHHVGLLFLKADTFQGPYSPAAAEGEDAQVVARRLQIQFDAALNRLRGAASIGDAETAVAWAVLLTNMGRYPQALDRVNDALKVHSLQTVRAWLRLMTPPDNVLTVPEIDRIWHDLPTVEEAPGDDYNTSFVRALLHVAAGRWEDAWRALRECKKQLRGRGLPTHDGTYQAWFTNATGEAKAMTTRYLYHTLDILMGYVSVPGDLRIRLGQELLQRLANATLMQQEGMKPDEVRGLQATVHVKVAQTAAGNNDRAAVFEHLEEALKLRAPDITRETIEKDSSFDTWKGTPELQALLKKYEPPPK
jgi:tetratricopeptide (TPR) repeat protein/predicted Ser/Thr protein kinase